jgi:DNA-binding response OmpR family regulator
LDGAGIPVYAFSRTTRKMSDDRTKDSYSRKSLRILVVEDHGDTLQALSNLLTHFGHKISVADDAESARKIIGSTEFDVVLADIGLPDGSGYDLVAEAKRKRPVKVVALTGLGAPDDIERSKEAGFDFHLTKPVDFHELRAVLGQIPE